MLSQVLAIARNAFVESLRQPVVFILIMVSGLFQVFNTWTTGYSLGYTTMDSAEVEADTKLLFDIGLSTIFGLGTILAGFVATAVISKEIENKTVLTVISKPISRVAVVLGKFSGVAGALVISMTIMVIFLLLAVRHQVLTNATDEYDQPVLVFGLTALLLGLGVAAWTNYFYGWSFPQTAVVGLLPLMLVAYVGVLFFAKDWTLQPLVTDLKPQVLTACACLALAVLVLSSVAVAASTRLGQVMTIVVCFGVFVGSLLSNYFLGRRVFFNEPIGVVDTVTPSDASRNFLADRSPSLVRMRQPPLRPIEPGTPIYYATSPNGFPMLSPAKYEPFTGKLTDINDLVGPRSPMAILATQAQGQEITLRPTGPRPLAADRGPQAGDYLFTRPTSVRTPLLLAWGALPNMQHFWLLDAVSQNHPVPVRYLALVVIYAFAQTGAFLSLAVVLFQRRDVG